MIQDNFLPYPLSLEMKNLGFDEECLGYYIPEEDNELCYYLIENKNLTGNSYVAPLFSQAAKFLRDKYGIHIEVVEWNKLFSGKVKPLGKSVVYQSDNFDTYEEAQLAAFTEAINIVKPQVK